MSTRKTAGSHKDSKGFQGRVLAGSDNLFFFHLTSHALITCLCERTAASLFCRRVLFSSFIGSRICFLPASRIF